MTLKSWVLQVPLVQQALLVLSVLWVLVVWALEIVRSYPGPMSVVGLTGINGVVSFGSAITNPTITQTATASTNGQF